MYQQLQLWALVAMTSAQVRLDAGRDTITRRLRDEDGMSTETVIITALLAALAIAVGAIITVKVTSKANSIPVD